MLTSANWLDNEVKNYLQYRKIYVKNQVIDPDVFLIMSTLDVSKYVFIVYRKVSLHAYCFFKELKMFNF